MQPLRTRLLKATLLLPLVAAFNSNSNADTLSLTTSNGVPWTITGAGAVNATPAVFRPTAYGGPVTALSFTSTGNGYGTYVPGTSPDQFSGYWKADFTFTLPANAQNISLSFNNLTFADRGVLLLNGNRIAATGVDAGNLGNTASGYMVLTDFGSSQPYSFSGGDYFLSGVVTSGFNVGGVNTVEAIINNTYSGISAPLRASLPQSDSTYFGLAATVSYNSVDAPEPGTGALLLGGGLLLGVLSRKRRA